MLNEKSAAPLLEQTEPRADKLPAKDHVASVADGAPQVKYVDRLTVLRNAKGLPVKAMVDVVQAIYPKYDKTVQSKCEHGNEYGIQLRADAYRALVAAFAPEMAERQERSSKRNAYRIQARLTESTLKALKEALHEDGFTIQMWMERQVDNYLEGRIKHD